MGVNRKAILAVGTEFDTAYEVVLFLDQYNLLTEEDKEYLENNEYSSITEVADGIPSLPTVECLDYYTGDGYYVGFRIYVRDVNEFQQNVTDAFCKWNKLFPNNKAEIIHTVQVS